MEYTNFKLNSTKKDYLDNLFLSFEYDNYAPIKSYRTNSGYWVLLKHKSLGFVIPEYHEFSRENGEIKYETFRAFLNLCDYPKSKKFLNEISSPNEISQIQLKNPHVISRYEAELYTNWYNSSNRNVQNEQKYRNISKHLRNIINNGGKPKVRLSHKNIKTLYHHCSYFKSLFSHNKDFGYTSIVEVSLISNKLSMKFINQVRYQFRIKQLLDDGFDIKVIC